MNKERRAALALLIPRIEEAAELLSSIQAELSDLRDEEQDYYDNMPESFQQSDRGYAAEQAVSQMEEALDVLDSFAEGHRDAINAIEDATA